MWPSHAQPVAPERRVALVIGNSAYKTDALRNPVNDARDMAAALRAVDFEVIDRFDATKREMNRELSEFGGQLARGGVGLFYFAGHGVQSEGRNFLLAVDCDIEIESDIESETADIAGSSISLAAICDSPLRRALAANAGKAAPLRRRGAVWKLCRIVDDRAGTKGILIVGRALPSPQVMGGARNGFWATAANSRPGPAIAGSESRPYDCP